MPATRPSLRCRRDDRPRRSRSCGCRDRSAGDVLTALAGRLPPPRMATRALIRIATGQPIDDAVVLWFPGAGERDRRGRRRISHSWRPRGAGGADRGAVVVRRRAAGRARRIHPARVRERQARSDRGRGARRSDPCRHRAATSPGAAAAQRPARRPGARLACADHRGAGAGRGRRSIFPTRATCRTS